VVPKGGTNEGGGKRQRTSKVAEGGRRSGWEKVTLMGTRGLNLTVKNKKDKVHR